LKNKWACDSKRPKTPLLVWKSEPQRGSEWFKRFVFTWLRSSWFEPLTKVLWFRLHCHYEGDFAKALKHFDDRFFGFLRKDERGKVRGGGKILPVAVQNSWL